MTNIFVAKLDFGVSDETLKGLFENYGTVLKCQIAKDRETGKPRGFAFVEMQTPEETQAAIKGLDGHTINGRSMVVKLAEDRSSGKGGNKRNDSRPRRDFDKRPPRSPRTEASSGDSQKKPDSYSVPVAPQPESAPSAEEKPKKTKRGKNKSKSSDKPENREYKMSAHKKSGKRNRIQFDDDDDWEMEFRRNQKSGWDNDEDDY